jgi:hypothetical protein
MTSRKPPPRRRTPAGNIETTRGAGRAIADSEKFIAESERPRPKVKPPKPAGFKPAARGDRINPSVPNTSRGPGGPAHDLGKQTGPRMPRSTDGLREAVDVGTSKGNRP